MTIYILSRAITEQFPKPGSSVVAGDVLCGVCCFLGFFVNWYDSPFWVQETSMCVVLSKYPFDSYKMSFPSFLEDGGWEPWAWQSSRMFGECSQPQGGDCWGCSWGSGMDFDPNGPFQIGNSERISCGSGIFCHICCDRNASPGFMMCCKERGFVNPSDAGARLCPWLVTADPAILCLVSPGQCEFRLTHLQWLTRASGSVAKWISLVRCAQMAPQVWGSP